MLSDIIAAAALGIAAVTAIGSLFSDDQPSVQRVDIPLANGAGVLVQFAELA